MLYSNLEKIVVTGVTLYLLLASSGFAGQLAAPGAAADCSPTPVPVGGQYQDN